MKTYTIKHPKQILCEICKREIRANNYEKHINKCRTKCDKRQKLKFSQFEKVDDKYKCPHCGKLCKKRGIAYHVWKHNEGKDFAPSRGRIAWNHGLTKETDNRILNAAKKLSKSIAGVKRHALSDEHKKILSEKMTLAHERGDAFCFAKLEKPSYPEKMFESIVNERFNDKNYIREFHILSYYLDFAWLDKKLDIEIDGSQHRRNIERDIRRDLKMTNLGWKVLRIPVTDLYKNTEKWIKFANEFVGT